MYTLIDTFNDRVISRHRTLQAAIRADIKHARAVRLNNGANSYIPTDIICADGRSVDAETYNEMRYKLAS